MEKGTCSSLGELEGLASVSLVELAWEGHWELWSELLHTLTMQVTLTWVPWLPEDDSELLELARASPDPLVLSAPGAWSWDGVGPPLSGALAELSRELLLELGAVVSRCCCSGPGTLRAFSAGRCGTLASPCRQKGFFFF